MLNKNNNIIYNEVDYQIINNEYYYKEGRRFIMIKGLMLLADGFEDSEGVVTRDILVRAGIDLTTASIKNSKEVATSLGLIVQCDKMIGEIKESEYDFIVLPGGGRGTANLVSSDDVHRLLDDFHKKDKLLCAICAAPSVLGRYGYLVNKKFTCFPSFENGINGFYTGKEVETDHQLITARSMAFSIPFALAIVQRLLGEAIVERVSIGIKGLAKK